MAPPRLRRCLARLRLFRALDSASRKGSTWIGAEPGSGKTTLVASWLDVRGRPALWHRVDPGAAAAAAFLHDLQVAPRRAPPARPLQPEYLRRPDLFARRIYERILASLPDGCAVVLDDLQEGGAEGFFPELLRLLVETASQRTPSSSSPTRSRASASTCFGRRSGG